MLQVLRIPAPKSIVLEPESLYEAYMDGSEV